MTEPQEKLVQLISQISDLEKMRHSNNEFFVWYNAVQRTLKRIFGESDERIKQFDGIHFSLIAFSTATPDSHFQKAYMDGLEQSRLLLHDFLTEIPSSEHVSYPTQTFGEDIFIVHGRDNEAKQETARLIEKLNLNAVILHERPNKGRTVIEKLVEESKNAGYAVILLTPDDIGSIKGNSGKPEERARQNVVLELGYFLGILGRERVCILLKGSISIPSDFIGVLYIPMDSAGKWKYDLAKELKEVGFNLNVEKIS